MSFLSEPGREGDECDARPSKGASRPVAAAACPSQTNCRPATCTGAKQSERRISQRAKGQQRLGGLKPTERSGEGDALEAKSTFIRSRCGEPPTIDGWADVKLMTDARSVILLRIIEPLASRSHRCGKILDRQIVQIHIPDLAAVGRASLACPCRKIATPRTLPLPLQPAYPRNPIRLRDRHVATVLINA